jgi:hypothetical protein
VRFVFLQGDRSRVLESVNFEQEYFLVKMNDTGHDELVADEKHDNVENGGFLVVEVETNLDNLKVVEKFHDDESVHQKKDRNVKRHPLYKHRVKRLWRRRHLIC